MPSFVSHHSSGLPFAPDGAHVVAHVRHPGRDVDVRIELRPGTTTAVIGPNGAGKSTLVAAIAGTLGRTPSHVEVRGQEWDGPGVYLPAHRRHCGYLAQEALLFPHLSGVDNVAYPFRARAGLARRSARRAAWETLERVGAAQWADKGVAQLSGGQAARIALARAIAIRPDVMLLDEPFAALDVESAAEMRQACADVLAGVTTVLVTHHVQDVRVLADDVVVLETGRVCHRAAAADLSADTAADTPVPFMRTFFADLGTYPTRPVSE